MEREAQVKQDIFTRTDQVFGRFLRINLLSDGSITGIENRTHTFFDSIIRNLEQAGNIREYFDLSAYPSLDLIPALSDPACIHPDPVQNHVFAVFVNSRDFSREDHPELFYTTLPSTLLSVCRVGPDRFCGILRTMPTVPDIYLERSSGIVYVDEKERLIGFNHTFHEFFQYRFRSPQEMLRKPVSAFLNPTPGQVQADKLKQYAPQEEAALETVFTLEKGGLEFSRPGCDRASAAGLCLDNRGPGNLYCKLPVRLNTRLDFDLEMEIDLEKGDMPLVTVGKEGGIGDFPDRFGYLIGPDLRGRQIILKRKGLTNLLGEKSGAFRKGRMAVRKAGNAIRFVLSGREALAFYDSNFLHTEEGMITFGLREGSACLFREVRLRCARESLHLEDTPVVIKLNTPEQRYFTLNRLSVIHLAINYPSISAYVLENVTEIQKQVNALESQYHLNVPANLFVGRSPITEAIREKATLVAESDATVLIQGATGTGKEVLANEIHEKSRRKGKPFIKVDCATIPRDLLESELFGHEKGAFTGAVERKIGLFEQADQGTLFLDEVANLSLDTQQKLLQFLQDRRITRVGGERPVSLNVRVIVAANVPLATLVEKGLFRADLYYRIDVVSIFLPPLKERKEDIPDLARLFILEMDRRHNRKVAGLSKPAMDKIVSYPWPGNIRELKNVIERAVIFCKGDEIRPEQVQFSAPAGEALPGGRKAHRFIRLETEEIRRLFEKHRGRARDVARELDIAPRTLYYQLKRMGIDVEGIRQAG